MLWYVKLLLEGALMWPDTKHPKLLITSTIIITFASIFTWCGILFYIVNYINDFNKATYGTCLLVLPTLSVIKTPLIGYKYKAIKNLLNQIEADFWPCDIIGMETMKELKTIYFFSVSFMVFFLILAQTYYGAFLVLPMFLTERTLPLPCTLPFGWTDKLSYAFMYILQFICLQFGIIFVVMGTDFLTLSLCLCASNQYRILRKCFLIYNTGDMLQTNDRLRTISKGSMKKNYVLEKEYLIRLINHHNLLIKFTRYLNEVLNPLELGNLLVSIMGICLGTFVLSMNDISTFNRILAAIYLLGFVMQLAIDCTVGSELYYQASLLPDCIFHSDWKLLNDNNLKKDILFLLQTSQCFPQFAAYNVYELNMSTFLKVQKFAFSIYTLLSNMSKTT